jgi:threonine/homoserine/homoserine lactone efflux protein
MLDNVFALIAATAVLVIIPGPNAALIVANSLSHGLRFGLITVAGTTVGIAMQLAMVVAGMAAVIELAGSALAWIKWLGVAYLLYLGVRTWFENVARLGEVSAQSDASTFWRGLALAVINPKTLLFNAAFLPQFVSSASAAGSQLLLLAGIFLSVIFVGDSLWAVFAASARNYLQQTGRLRNKVTGAFLFGGGVALAFVQRDT